MKLIVLFTKGISPLNIKPSWGISRLKHLLVFAGALVVFATGCHTVGPSGTGTGSNEAITAADISISAAREVFSTFDRWEKENRKELADTREVKHYADVVRVNSNRWLLNATELRNAYATDRTEQNLVKLQTCLAELTSSMSEAQSLLAGNTWKVLP